MSIYALGEHRPSFGEGSWVADNATVIGQVKAGRNVSFWYNVVVRSDNDIITIGDDTNIQDGAILHCDYGVPLSIGKRVSLGIQGDDARQQDHPTKAHPEQPLRSSLYHSESTGEIGVDNVGEFCFGHAQQERVFGDASVCDDDFNSAKLLFNLREGRVDRRSISHLGMHSE